MAAEEKEAGGGGGGGHVRRGLEEERRDGIGRGETRAGIGSEAARVSRTGAAFIRRGDSGSNFFYRGTDG